MQRLYQKKMRLPQITSWSRSTEDYLELKIIHTPSTLIFYGQLVAEDRERKWKQPQSVNTDFVYPDIENRYIL